MEQDRKRNLVYLYGLDDEYHVLRHSVLFREDLTISRLRSLAASLAASHPGIEFVFTVDDSHAVYRAYREAKTVGLVDDRVCFKHLLETDGIRLI